jgi:hypothetical protein
MSKTISFVASDELADYLEEEAERRMTTVSSTAQMLLAEHVSEVEQTQKTDSEARTDSILERHPDAWYEPDSLENDYAVYVPDDAGVHDEGKTRYFKTEGGASDALKRWYE